MPFANEAFLRSVAISVALLVVHANLDLDK